jgi:predicted amidohydrolase
MAQLKIAAAQIDVALADAPRNLARMQEVVRETRRQGARLTVFPECALAGYCYESLEEARPHAQSVPGPATESMVSLCRELDVFVVFGLLETAGGNIHNACVLVGPSGVLGSYRKVHLPYLGIDRFATPGDGFSVADAGGVRVGMQICYDGAFPEAARVQALEGADLIVLPTNWPPGSECTPRTVISTRALENNVYFAAVNRVGVERGFRFIGQSKVCAPDGSDLASADHADEAILYAEIDPAKARDKHIIRVPGKHEINRFADRRPDTYGRILDPVAHRRRAIEK